MKTPDPDHSSSVDAKLLAIELRRGTRQQAGAAKEDERLAAALGVSLSDLDARADLDFANARREAEAALARARGRQAQKASGLAPLRERLEAQYLRPQETV